MKTTSLQCESLLRNELITIFYKRTISTAIIIVLLLTGFLPGTASAQQSPMYSQYMFNMLTINPAYAGNRGVAGITGLYRNQWVGIKGAPVTGVLSLDMPVHQDKIGLGFQFYQDKLGIEKTSGFNFSYAFRIRMSNAGTLSLGLQAGVLDYRASYTDVETVQSGDPLYQQNVSGILPSAAAGIFYNSDNFYVGISTPALLKTKVAYDNSLTVLNEKARDLHLYMTTGIALRVSDNVVFKPSVLLKVASGAPSEYDFNANVWLHDIVSLGFSYRTGDSYVTMAELQIKPELRIGYAYDKTFSALGPFTSGTHELMIRYEFKGRNKLNSPRYF